MTRVLVLAVAALVVAAAVDAVRNRDAVRHDGARTAARAATAAPTMRSAPAAAEQDGPRGCPRANWPGPWTRCAEAEWVRDVVSRAGYRVTTQTGSAFVASDGRTSFYVWTTEGDAEVAGAQDGWQSLTAVAGTPVYGDEDLWRFWSAQGFIFWVKQGPTPTATLPSPSDLRSLIAASHELPPPPP